MHRDAELPGTLQQRGIDRRAADSHKAQRFRQLPASRAAHDQRLQQLRDQNHAVGAAMGQHIEKGRQCETSGTVEAQGFLFRDNDSGATAQRRMHAGDVLKQGGQRQHAQVTGNAA